MRIQPPNYTQTPNDLFDHWLPHLSEGELKVLLVIMRKTFGWHKTHDAISVSQLAKHTGMREETVINSAKSLQSKGVITREVVGPAGKQQTIYSLKIETENPNNSYPSDQPPPSNPRPPLGSAPPVQSEAQKKPFHKETIQKKQQQQAAPTAAVFSKNQERQQQQQTAKAQPYVKPIQSKIHPILQHVDIPLADKIEITSRFDEQTVINAITWTQKTTKPIKCLAAAIKWACKSKPELPLSKEDEEQKNKSYAMRYDNAENNSSTVRCFNRYVEISNCGVNAGTCVGYDEAGFMEQFQNALRKNGFNIL